MTAPWMLDLNNPAATWPAAMGRASWQGGAALALVWVACRCWPRLPVPMRCWLWRLAYVQCCADCSRYDQQRWHRSAHW